MKKQDGIEYRSAENKIDKMFKKCIKTFFLTLAFLSFVVAIISCERETLLMNDFKHFKNSNVNIFFIFEIIVLCVLFVFFLFKQFDKNERIVWILKKTKKNLLWEFKKKPYRENILLQQKTICDTEDFFSLLFEKKFAFLSKEKRTMLLEATFSDMKIDVEKTNESANENASDENCETLNVFDDKNDELEELETLESVDESTNESELEEVSPRPFSFTDFHNAKKKLETLSPYDLIESDESGVYSIKSDEALSIQPKNKDFQNLVDSILKK